MQQVCWLALAGALGTLSRYGMSGWVQRLGGESFHWGTLAVNAVGCFLIAVVWTLAEDRLVISGQTRFIVVSGFLGAFTTFSTFALETSQLARDAEWWLATANIAAQNIVGVACVFAGFAIGRWL